MSVLKPGSITKNIGWDVGAGPGLSRLRDGIRIGFAGQRVRTLRDVFRARVDPTFADRQLVLVNFFLHNRQDGENYVSVDELVRISLDDPHSPMFDRLALFALHLSRVGQRTGNIGHPHGAAYLGDFARTILWEDGAWRGDRLTHGSIEAHLEAAMVHKAGSDTVHKTVTNYLFMFEQVAFPRRPDGTFDVDLQSWVHSAAFLAFDRYCLDASPLFPLTVGELVEAACADQLHKLMGVGEEELGSHLPALATRYLESGGLGRL